MNDFIHHSLNRAGILATRKPHGHLRVNGKRSDGLTLISWRKGRFLVWDVTVADTTAASYLAATVTSAAESATVRKEYIESFNCYHFFSIAIESLGPLSNKATSFLSDLDFGWCRPIRLQHQRQMSGKQVFFFDKSP